MYYNMGNFKAGNHPKKHFSVVAVLVMLLSVVIILSFKSAGKPPAVLKASVSKADSVESKKAFLKVYAVLMNPRCMNCHPSGDVPLQGDDSHLHLQGVKRGLDGKGLYALKCSNCHQFNNLPGLHMPPGNPKWELPPANMKMIFQGRSPHELSKQLLDKKRNGGKSVKALIDHITNDGLVLGGWKPADGLSAPPLSHKEFVRAFNEWIQKGAVCP
jgi:hypothetical protein